MRDFPPTINTNRSMCCSRIGRRWLESTGNGGRVTYTLSIKLWIGAQTVATRTEDINLIPANSLAPPICAQDFPKDYKIAQPKVLRRLFKKPRKVPLEISVLKPQPLMCSSTTDILYTRLGFSIACEGIESASTENLGLVLESCDVSLGLKAKTIISSRPLRAQPTASQLKFSPSLSEMTQEYPYSVKTLNLPPWKEVSREDSGVNKVCRASIFGMRQG